MPFLKRLGFYLIGLSVGLVFLAIFLKKKSAETGTQFCYLPNCRVLKELRSKPLSYSNNIQRKVEGGELDSLEIRKFLTNGDVDFGKSNTHGTPCKTYFIESREGHPIRVMELRDCEEGVILVSVSD